MQEFITQTYQLVLPPLLGYIVWNLQQQTKVRSATALGIKEVLGYMLDRLYEEFVYQGYVTTEQFNRFEALYKPYEALKGNGARKKKWEEVKKMDIEDNHSSISPFMQMFLDKQKENK